LLFPDIEDTLEISQSILNGAEDHRIFIFIVSKPSPTTEKRVQKELKFMRTRFTCE